MRIFRRISGFWPRFALPEAAGMVFTGGLWPAI